MAAKDEDEALWQRATADVRPLGQAPVPPRRKRPDADAAPAPAVRPPADPREFENLLRNSSGFDVRDDGEALEGRAAGIDYDLLRRLKRGAFPIEVRLDLHGLNREGAQRRLVTTLVGAHRAGRRAVLVIHGRGTHSGGDAVLRRELPRWLTEPPLAAIVMCFAGARPEMGGAGATCVLLRT